MIYGREKAGLVSMPLSFAALMPMPRCFRPRDCTIAAALRCFSFLALPSGQQEEGKKKKCGVR